MSKHAAYSYVEIDDADMERTHLWVTVNGVDGEMIELIEQYPVEQRESAYVMTRRLADLLDLPLKLCKDRNREPRSLDS
jgi:hypothetical protein